MLFSTNFTWFILEYFDPCTGVFVPVLLVFIVSLFGSYAFCCREISNKHYILISNICKKRAFILICVRSSEALVGEPALVTGNIVNIIFCAKTASQKGCS